MWGIWIWCLTFRLQPADIIWLAYNGTFELFSGLIPGSLCIFQTNFCINTNYLGCMLSFSFLGQRIRPLLVCKGSLHCFLQEPPVPFPTHTSHVTDQGFLHSGRHCGLLLFSILDTHTGAVIAVCGDTLTVAFSDGLDGDHPPMFSFVSCGFLSENCVCKSFAYFLTGLFFLNTFCKFYIWFFVKCLVWK